MADIRILQDKLELPDLKQHDAVTMTWQSVAKFLYTEWHQDQ